MKKIMVFISLLVVLSTQLACGAGDLLQSHEADGAQVATSVAETLAAIPAETSTPTVEAPPPALTLDDFPNRELLGEDAGFAVFLANASADDAMEKSGELVVQDKTRGQVVQIDGTFTFMGSVQVYSDDAGNYVLLSAGTYTTRQAQVIDVAQKAQAGEGFCLTAGQYGSQVFWKDYVIYNNCEHFDNRPWGAGEAPGITALNLKSGQVTEIAKSDLTHQYNVRSVSADTLQYEETTVPKEGDWQNSANQNTNVLSFDLSTLAP